MINQWTPCSEKQPEKAGHYWLTYEDNSGNRHVGFYFFMIIEGLGRPDSFWELRSSDYKAIAWMDVLYPSAYVDPLASEAAA